MRGSDRITNKNFVTDKSMKNTKTENWKQNSETLKIENLKSKT